MSTRSRECEGKVSTGKMGHGGNGGGVWGNRGCDGLRPQGKRGGVQGGVEGVSGGGALGCGGEGEGEGEVGGVTGPHSSGVL